MIQMTLTLKKIHSKIQTSLSLKDPWSNARIVRHLQHGMKLQVIAKVPVQLLTAGLIWLKKMQVQQLEPLTKMSGKSYLEADVMV